MLLLKGACTMVITNICIEGLYSEYNYQIEFDSRLNFLYGSNGCGKTTVLNILTSIVTGRLYNLFEYEFDRIILRYKTDKEIKQKIIICSRDEGRDIDVYFEETKYILEDVNLIKERLFRRSRNTNLEKNFFMLFPVAEKINKTFNYRYLPLNRYENNIYAEDMREVYYYNNERYYPNSKQDIYITYLNESLKHVEKLVRQTCNQITLAENSIDRKFRKDILSSSVAISTDMPIQRIFKEIDKYRWDDVLKSKEGYIKSLEETGVYDELLKDKIQFFFKNFKKTYDEYQTSTKKAGIALDFAWQYAEFLKIKDIAELARKNEEKKERVRMPLDKFLRIINNFFYSSGSGKEIKISPTGVISFQTRNRKLSLQKLSSGEKQIVITFANLILGMNKKNTKGIFIVDEPEASLHLEWQAKFIPAILDITNDVQLIFATHSPELIGRYRNKAIRLVRN